MKNDVSIADNGKFYVTLEVPRRKGESTMIGLAERAVKQELRQARARVESLEAVLTILGKTNNAVDEQEPLQEPLATDVAPIRRRRRRRTLNGRRTVVKQRRQRYSAQDNSPQ